MPSSEAGYAITIVYLLQNKVYELPINFGTLTFFLAERSFK